MRGDDNRASERSSRYRIDDLRSGRTGGPRRLAQRCKAIEVGDEHQAMIGTSVRKTRKVFDHLGALLRAETRL
jgi:hypothetical protein